MIQTLGDIRQATYNRMFLEQVEYQDYDPQFPEAVNSAMLEMCKRYPIQRMYELTKNVNQGNIENNIAYEKYNMIENTELQGERTFMSFAENPVFKVTEEGIIPFNNYSTSLDTYLYLPSAESGSFQIYYNAYPKKVTSATPYSYVMEFEPEKCALLPLLIAWQLFNDDDLTRATMYYNEYYQSLEDLPQAEKTTSGITISGGFAW